MKKISTVLLLISFIAISFTTLKSQGTWEKLDVPANEYLKSVCFVDSLYGWIVGDAGMILHTTDGGDSWTVQESQTENEIFNVFFLDRNLGWASSFDFTSPPYKTDILKTTNGGEDWTSTPYPENEIFITCIYFLDEQTGFMGGTPHALVKTTDGGETWKQAEVDSTMLAYFPVLNITFYDDNYGFAGGGIFDIAGTMWRTSDGGDSWQPIDAMYAPADEVHKVHMIDPMHIIAAGGDPDYGYGVAIMKSSDGGETWSYEELGMQGNAYDMEFRTDNEIWCPLGPGRTMIFSLDAGSTWSQVPTPDSTAIFDLTFPDPMHGFAIGQDGAVLRFIPSITTSVETNGFNHAELQLEQNFPNPFSSDTRIGFVVPENLTGISNTTPVELKIYNVQGEIVKVLINEEMTPGEYQAVVHGDDLPVGRYMYRLNINRGEATIAKHMIKIR